MKSKQIYITIQVREDYVYDTQGSARLEIEIPVAVLSNVDFGAIASALLTEAVHENDELVAEKQRKEAEKEAASNGHITEPIPA